MQQVCAVIAVAAFIADSDNNILQDDETLLVLEGLALYLLRLHGPVAILAWEPDLFSDSIYGSPRHGARLPRTTSGSPLFCGALGAYQKLHIAA